MSTQITEGARSLRAYLLRTEQTVPDFCEKHDLSRRIVQRALNGQQTTFSVDFALAVQKATNGEVTAGSWSQDTLRDAAPEELGRLFPRHRPRPGAVGHTANDFAVADDADDEDEPTVDEPSGPVCVVDEYSQVPAAARG